MKKIFILLIMFLIGTSMVKEECKADNITNDLIKNYASKFEEYDTNKDGEYSEEELQYSQ